MDHKFYEPMTYKIRTTQKFERDYKSQPKSRISQSNYTTNHKQSFVHQQNFSLVKKPSEINFYDRNLFIMPRTPSSAYNNNFDLNNLYEKKLDMKFSRVEKFEDKISSHEKKIKNLIRQNNRLKKEIHNFKKIQAGWSSTSDSYGLSSKKKLHNTINNLKRENKDLIENIEMLKLGPLRDVQELVEMINILKQKNRQIEIEREKLEKKLESFEINESRKIEEQDSHFNGIITGMNRELLNSQKSRRELLNDLENLKSRSFNLEREKLSMEMKLKMEQSHKKLLES